MTTAFIFPGQGSQSVGMLSDFADSPLVKETFEEASSVLGFDLWNMTQQGPDSELNSTDNTQPALLTASIALYRLWISQSDALPQVMAGHSLGEYSALVAAGTIEFKDAVQLVRTRGQFMQAAVPEGVGAMAAILGLEDQVLVDLCKKVSNNDEFVSAANFNSSGQVVVAGHKAAVEAVVAEAKEAGAKRSVILPVSVPSHCELMKPAAEKLKDIISDITFKESSISVIQNVDANVHTDINVIKESLIEQLYKPVQWTKCIGNLSEQNIETVIECGPGKVLSGLVKRIDRNLTCLPILDKASFDKAIETLN